MTPRRLPLLPTLLALCVLLLASLGASVSLGQANSMSLGENRITFGDVQAALLHPLPYPESSENNPQSEVTRLLEVKRGIVWDSRLSRAILAGLIGASLAVAGAALQGLLGNPLAEPYTIGVSSGAAVGAGVAIFVGWGAVWGGGVTSLFALAAALLTLGLVFALARSGGQVSTGAFLLAGVAIGAFLWALLTLILSLARVEQREILRWLMGRLGDADWLRVWILLPVMMLATGFFAYVGRGLDAFAFGEDTARSVGVSVERFKIGVLFVAALATAASVSIAGIIAFVGLIVPHCGRALVGPSHGKLVPVCAVLGAILTVCADLIARTILPGEELPVGVVTSLVGAPFFALLLRGQTAR